MFDRIELIEPKYGTVTKGSKVRKIKFKSLSFLNISNVWKNFRLKRANARLEKAKETVVNMEFGMGSFDRRTGDETSRAEKKILKKATAVARLEAKINFLQFGTKETDDFVSSRAIKIKDNMMKNMCYNADAAYSIPEDKKESIFAVEKPITSSVIAAAEKGVSDALNRIMGNKTAAHVAPAPITTSQEEETTTQEETTTPVIKAPTREEIKKTVEGIFAAEQKQKQQATAVTTQAVVAEEVEPEFNEVDTRPVIEKKDVAQTINTELEKIDVVPPVKKDDVADTIQEELSKIVVTKNQSNKVNPFINEDGTYRMKKEDIDADFRVTRVTMTDKEKRIEDIRNANLTVQFEFLTRMQRIKDDLEQQAKQEGRVIEEAPEVERALHAERKMPEVAPDRNPVQDVKTLDAAVDEDTTKDDLASIMESVTSLQRKQADAEAREAEIAADEQALKEEKSQVVEELLAYKALLQADVERRTQGLSQREADNKAMVKEIESMRQVMRRR